MAVAFTEAEELDGPEEAGSEAPDEADAVWVVVMGPEDEDKVDRVVPAAAVPLEEADMDWLTEADTEEAAEGAEETEVDTEPLAVTDTAALEDADVGDGTVPGAEGVPEVGRPDVEGIVPVKERAVDGPAVAVPEAEDVTLEEEADAVAFVDARVLEADVSVEPEGNPSDEVTVLWLVAAGVWVVAEVDWPPGMDAQVVDCPPEANADVEEAEDAPEIEVRGVD